MNKITMAYLLSLSSWTLTLQGCVEGESAESNQTQQLQETLACSVHYDFSNNGLDVPHRTQGVSFQATRKATLNIASKGASTPAGGTFAYDGRVARGFDRLMGYSYVGASNNSSWEFELDDVYDLKGNLVYGRYSLQEFLVQGGGTRVQISSSVCDRQSVD